MKVLSTTEAKKVIGGWSWSSTRIGGNQQTRGWQ